nr:MAG TPA: hypothetical protein [Caudoviricetes sp.]
MNADRSRRARDRAANRMSEGDGRKVMGVLSSW